MTKKYFFILYLWGVYSIYVTCSTPTFPKEITKEIATKVTKETTQGITKPSKNPLSLQLIFEGIPAPLIDNFSIKEVALHTKTEIDKGLKKINFIKINGELCLPHHFKNITRNIDYLSITPPLSHFLLSNFQELTELSTKHLSFLATKHGCKIMTTQMDHEISIKEKNQQILLHDRVVIYDIKHNDTVIRENSPVCELTYNLVLSHIKDKIKVQRISMIVHGKNEAFNPYWFLSEEELGKEQLLSMYGINNNIIDKLKERGYMEQFLPNKLQIKQHINILKCASLISDLYEAAAEKEQSFIKGSFSIEDKDNKLYKTLYSLAKNSTKKYFYNRNPQENRSSHYILSPKQYGLDITLNDTSNPIDILPNDRHHILFGSVQKGHSKKATFIKCETHGLATNFEYLIHIKQYLIYRLIGRKNKQARRETDLPKGLVDPWKKFVSLINREDLLVEAIPVYKISEILKATKINNKAKFQAKELAIINELEGVLLKYEKNRGPVYLIDGNEFIIRQSKTNELIKKLHRQIKLDFDYFLKF